MSWSGRGPQRERRGAQQEAAQVRRWALALCVALANGSVALPQALADPPKARAASAAQAGSVASAAGPRPAASAQPAARAVLLVTGGGKPVVQADVLLRAAGQGELKAFTDGRGELSFVPTASRYTVRVLAKGWVTFEQEFTIQQGSRTEIQLSPKKRPG